uniref:Uncharacterized protein n=1 Tax=Anguilla anguilla TaxID=7936 RepID=A0A0E9WLL4_ANGAN
MSTSPLGIVKLESHISEALLSLKKCPCTLDTLVLCHMCLSHFFKKRIIVYCIS